jgi:hypothetical protein
MANCTSSQTSRDERRRACHGVPGQISQERCGIRGGDIRGAKLRGSAGRSNRGAYCRNRVLKRCLLGIRQHLAVRDKARSQDARDIRASLRAEHVEERIVGAAQGVGNDLLEELPAEVKGGWKRVVAEAAPTNAVTRLQHDSRDTPQLECLGSAHPGQASANNDHIGITRATLCGGNGGSLTSECEGSKRCSGGSCGKSLEQRAARVRERHE